MKMNIYLKPRPDVLDIVFPNYSNEDTKEIHKICRKHIKGYGGHRWNKEHEMIEFHCEQDIGPWDLERLYKELEDWAYPPAQSEESKPEITQIPPEDE